MYSALMPEYDQPHRGRSSGASNAVFAAVSLGFLTLETGFLPILVAGVFARPRDARSRVERVFVLMLGFCLCRCGFCVLFAAGLARV